MNDLSTKTALVVDHGLFLPVALRLADSFKRVLYWTPFEQGFSSIKRACLGDGFERVERCLDIWAVKDEVDLWVFSDVENSGLQKELVAQGHAVWGSRDGDSLELSREKFMRTLGEVGLEVPEHTVIKGVENLRVFLRDKEDQYVKISRWRGDLETTHWRNWEMDEGLLDAWAVKFGPIKDCIRFLVFEAIDTDLELGCDTFSVDGQWPGVMLNGFECKDKSYCAAVTPRAQMPQQLQDVLDAFGPVLGEYQYRNQFSAEVRVQGDKAFFIDATCRGGLPSTGSQMALWKNFPEIIWAGAHGELVEPEHDDLFAMECVLTTKSEKGRWVAVELPEELMPFAKLTGCCFHNGRFCFPPDEAMQEEIGWLVATGKTPQETLDRMKELAAMLPDGVNANVESLADIIQEIESAANAGIPFTAKPLPAPAEVLSAE